MSERERGREREREGGEREREREREREGGEREGEKERERERERPTHRDRETERQREQSERERERERMNATRSRPWLWPVTKPRSGELRAQKLKSHLVITQSLNVLPFKPGMGQYIAIHATLTARDFFLAYFYPSSPLTCIFFKPLPIFPVLAVANTGDCVGPQNKTGHPAGCRFPC